MNGINGIIPLNKDRGMTSFDCVSKIRHILHLKKVGHSGTLDPDVDGVLPICLGNATKVVNFLMNSGKKYRGEITIGFATSTEDLDGEVVDSKPILNPISDAKIKENLSHFVSDHLKQIPPMYSAVKVNGKRLYEYARAGEKVKRPVRYVQVNDFKMVGTSEYDAVKKTQRFNFEVSCGKGTYIRTLAVMLGEKLGYPATMTDLTRTSSGHFDLAQSYTLRDVKNACEQGKLNDIIYPIDHALKGYPSVELSSANWKLVQNGGFLNRNELNENSQMVVLKYHGQTKAIYEPKPGTELYRPFKMFSTK